MDRVKSGPRPSFTARTSQKETDRGAVASMRRFLTEAGIRSREALTMSYKGYEAVIGIDEKG